MSKQVNRTSEQNSMIMRQIKASGSKIETTLQKELWRRGLRYRKNVSDVFGKPDICFKGLKIAVFCDSEFWHGYDWNNRRNDFKSNKEFWTDKIERNMKRDKEVTMELQAQGWIVLRYWGKNILSNTSVIADEIEDIYIERKRNNDKI